MEVKRDPSFLLCLTAVENSKNGHPRYHPIVRYLDDDRWKL